MDQKAPSVEPASAFIHEKIVELGDWRWRLSIFSLKDEPEAGEESIGG